MTETFEFTGKLKKSLYYMMGAGMVGLLFLLLYPHNHFARLWANVLANVYFFTGIGLFGLFAVAAAQVAYGHWQTMEKRILLSLSAFAAIGGFLLVAILGLGLLGVHSLYDPVLAILKKGPVKADSVYTTKIIYFAPVFWVGRVLLYAILWFGASRMMNKFFARTDQTDPKVYKRSKLLCAAFVVIFALTESAISWDMIMSLDPNWYSTLFGWYNFASYGCAAWGMTILIVIFLKSKGYIQRINENHVHDLGKMLFGFSILWSYMWFDQFMLQWYANIPDETSFWVKRFDVNYLTFTIFLSLIINFLFPLLFLITKGAKRNFKVIGFGAALLIFGHYIDFFNYTFVESGWSKGVLEKKKEDKLKAITGTESVLLAHTTEKKEAVASDLAPVKQGQEVVPDAVKMEGNKKEAKSEAEEPEGEEANHAGIGIGEILVFIGFLGVFLYMFFTNLAKRPIIPEDDPYLKENEKLEVIYS